VCACIVPTAIPFSNRPQVLRRYPWGLFDLPHFRSLRWSWTAIRWTSFRQWNAQTQSKNACNQRAICGLFIFRINSTRPNAICLQLETIPSGLTVQSMCCVLLMCCFCFYVFANVVAGTIMFPECLCARQCVHASVSPEQTLLARYLEYSLTEFNQTLTDNEVVTCWRRHNSRRSRTRHLVWQTTIHTTLCKS